VVNFGRQGRQRNVPLQWEHPTGRSKKTPLSEFANPRRGGIIAIKLDDEDSLIGVKHTDGRSQVIIGTREGLAIRFKEEDVRPIGRAGMACAASSS